MLQRPSLSAALRAVGLAVLITACGGDTTPPDTTRSLAVHEGDNQVATVGTALATAPAVRITNGAGAPVSGVAVGFSVASGGGSLAAGSATSDANGVARAGAWTLGQAAGPNTATAQITGGTGSVTFTATGNAGAPATGSKVAGDAQMADARAAVAVAPVVRLVDQFANPVPGVSISFAVTAGAGTVTGATVSTGADGRAAVGSWALGAAPGPNELTATVAGGTIAPLVFTATGREVLLQPSQDTVIQGGTLQVTRLVIPAGKAVTVAGDIVISADGVVEIAGSLVGNCVAVTINGQQSVTISGTVSNVCTNPSATPAPISIVALGGYDLSGAITAGGDFEVTNDPTLVDGDFPPETAPAQFRRGAFQAGTICGVNSLPVPPQAASGGAGTTGGPGRNARNMVARCRGDLSIGGLIAGQDGGDGGAGTDATGSASATGGRGGNGGDLKVLATGIVALGSSSVLRSGRGGDGGAATATGGTNGTGARAFSGTARGGNGGDPGLISVRAGAGVQVSTGARFTLGRGGRGGAAQATGALGKNATTTQPAQHGGHGTATGGKGGGLDPARLRKSGNVLGGPQVDGGNGGVGGAATATAGKGGDSDVEANPNGGDGGDFTGTGGDGGDALARDLQGNPVGVAGAGGEVTMSGGVGGYGFNGCSVDPKKAGGTGGEGGSADGTNGGGGTGGSPARNGAAGAVIYNNAGNGGKGGDGDGPGDGGQGGSESGFSLKAGTVPTKNGTNFADGADGLNCGLPPNKGAVRFHFLGIPIPSLPSPIAIIKQNGTQVALVTSVDQLVVLDPGNYTVETNAADPDGFDLRAGACLLTANVAAKGPASLMDALPCDFTVVVGAIIEITRTWIAINGLINWTVTGLPAAAAADILYTLCQIANPCSGPQLTGGLGASIFLLAGLYQILIGDVLVANGMQMDRYRAPSISQAVVAGLIYAITAAYVLHQTTRYFLAAIGVKTDPQNHRNFINMPAALALVLILTYSQPQAVSGGPPALTSHDIPIELSAPAPFVTVTGVLKPDSTITATGTGTVAGFPNVPVRFTGRLNADGSVTGDYEMGQNTAPTGLPGGSIVYSVDAAQTAPPAAPAAAKAQGRPRGAIRPS